MTVIDRAETMRIDVRPLSRALRDDFYTVHSEANGAGWCLCAAWWVATWDGWGARTRDENLEVREALFREGCVDGYLLYVDGRPAGWCQCGPRDELKKLVEGYRLPPDPSVHAVACFLLAPSHRRAGLARALLARVLDDLAARGVARVQAFPRRGEGLPDEDVWTGPESLFVSAGFTLERDDPQRPIYTKRLP